MKRRKDVPAVAVSRKGEELHNGILVVVELGVRRLADSDRLDAFALDLVHEAERKVDLRLDGRHERAVGDWGVGANNHFEKLGQPVLIRAMLARERRILTEVVGHVGNCAGEVRLCAGCRPPLPEISAVPPRELERRDIGRVIAGCCNDDVDGVQLAVLGHNTLGSDFRDRRPHNLHVALLKRLEISFAGGDAVFPRMVSTG